jgi:hypothetical protein
MCLDPALKGTLPEEDLPAHPDHRQLALPNELFECGQTAMQANTGFLAGIQPLRFTHRIGLLSIGGKLSQGIEHFNTQINIMKRDTRG